MKIIRKFSVRSLKKKKKLAEWEQTAQGKFWLTLLSMLFFSETSSIFAMQA